MALQDTTANIIVVDQASSLPNPNSVTGRTHIILNESTSAVAITSFGVNPFHMGGADVASVNLPAGVDLNFQSDGAKWQVTGNGANRAFFAGTALSDASGNAVFTFPVGLFSAPPIVDESIQFPAGQNPIDFRCTALTTTSCTINVRQSPTLVVLSLSVLGLSAPLAGVTVHLIATSPGSTP